MKLKLNLGILKGKEICFEERNHGRIFYIYGTLDNVKSSKDIYRFYFDDGRILEVKDTVLAKYIVRRFNDKIYLSFIHGNNKLSGLIGFSMFDTYGFPIEMTQEILREDGFELDIEGYEVLKQLQKEKAQGSYKNKDGWNIQ